MYYDYEHALLFIRRFNLGVKAKAKHQATSTTSMTTAATLHSSLHRRPLLVKLRVLLLKYW